MKAVTHVGEQVQQQNGGRNREDRQKVAALRSDSPAGCAIELFAESVFNIRVSADHLGLSNLYDIEPGEVPQLFCCLSMNRT